MVTPQNHHTKNRQDCQIAKMSKIFFKSPPRKNNPNSQPLRRTLKQTNPLTASAAPQIRPRLPQESHPFNAAAPPILDLCVFP